MRVQSTRFGTIEMTEEDVLTFPEGLLGFNELREFILLDDPTDEIFAWLQSCENPGIAFPVLEPELFSANYKVDLSKHDLALLKGDEKSRLRYFTIVTIPEDPTKMTANLKAPLVINIDNRLSRQCVLQDNSLEIKEPIFTKLQQRVVQSPSTPIKSQASEWGVAVKLPAPTAEGPDQEANS